MDQSLRNVTPNHAVFSYDREFSKLSCSRIPVDSDAASNVVYIVSRELSRDDSFMILEE